MSDSRKRMIADLCLGYGICHVLIFYFIGRLLLETAGINFLNYFQSGIEAPQALNILVLGLLLRTGDIQGSNREAGLGLYVGMGLFTTACLLTFFIK